MAVTQADIDALNRAIASGERQVVLGGQSVTYRSIEDLIRAKRELQSELADADAAASGRMRPKRTMLTYGGRGY